MCNIIDKYFFIRITFHLTVFRLFSCSAPSVNVSFASSAAPVATMSHAVENVTIASVSTIGVNVPSTRRIPPYAPQNANVQTVGLYVRSTRRIPPYAPQNAKKFNFKLGIYHSLEEVFDVFMSPEFIHFPEVQDLLQTYEDNAEYNSGRKYTRTKIRNVFAVIEGLQDTGSRIHGRRISEVLKGYYIVSPPKNFQHLRHWFDKQCYQLRSAFYALGNYVIAEKVKRQYFRQPVILNRYWHSQVAIALAKAAVKGHQFPGRNSTVYVWPKDLLIPDLVFFVSRRLRLKDFHAMTLRPRMSKEYTAMMTEAFLRLREPSVIDVDCGKYGNRPFLTMMQMINDTQAELEELRQKSMPH